MKNILTILGQIFVFDQNLIENENCLKIVNNVANFMKTNLIFFFFLFFKYA